jgi:hypothetical protein
LSSSRRHLVLLLPGLCGPQSDPPVFDYLQPRPAALDRLLSRSKPEHNGIAGLDATLCRWFGSADPRQDALPVAALTYRSDAGEAATGYVLRADPVHLRADQSSLRLFDAGTFAVTQEEADQLVAAFNAFYVGRGLQLFAPCPRRWYLLLAATPGITTAALSEVAGQDINAYLPRGDDAADWRRLLNEVQMLLHDHPVNAAREQRGEPAINSLWFWGGGLSPDPLRSRVVRIATDHPLAMGLALQAATPRVDVPATLLELLPLAVDGVTLVINDALASATRYADVEHWLEALRGLEKHWFVPLLAMLRRGDLNSLEIDPCNGMRFVINKYRQHAFWKRDRRFEILCPHE